MTEIRTEPVEAEGFQDLKSFRDARRPGSFHIAEDGEDIYFWSFCPCGCGAQSSIPIGRNIKPDESPSWNWNGDEAKPTLEPSINHVGHWHGWLRDGIWSSC
ncbi:DUF6527 family protein [Hoeflea poritis]|uniref:DUF6527 family protein n=1 Tax=Hoeflea poritis TaxID=2993659 RepID=A0ABT4VMM6_9HYPH|nr:DUF6527 family protein [Hoeflea poritis]MDA4845973.1 DUF6527 family protein [Hoeflea poritis]